MEKWACVVQTGQAPCFAYIKPSSEEQHVAGFLLRFIESARPLHLVELHGKPRLAAADAFAAGNAAGIGGWWLPEDSPPRIQNFRWFSCQFSLSALPAWFKADASLDRPVGLQVLICALDLVTARAWLAFHTDLSGARRRRRWSTHA